MLVSIRLVRRWSYEPALVVVAEAHLSPALHGRGKRDHSRPRSPARLCRLCDAGSSGRNEEIGGSVSWRLREVSRFLIGTRMCPIPHPLQAHCNPGRDAARFWGFSCEFSGTVFRFCRLGIRAPCPVDLPDAAARRAQKRGANVCHESTPRP